MIDKQSYGCNNHTKWLTNNQNHPETVEHFLQCQHPTWQQLWEELFDYIQHLTLQHNLWTTVCNHLVQSIRTAITAAAILPTTTGETPTYYTHQQQKGWKQLLYSWYSQAWITAIQQQDLPVNGQKLITTIIYLTWQQVITIWKVQNSHQHPPTTQNPDQTRLQETIQQILHDAQQHPHLAAMIRHIDIDQLMTQPTKTIQQFISWSHNHIRDFDQAAATQARLHTHNIRNYFQRTAIPQPATTTDKNLLRPP